jgi:transcriptional regulator of acetoin/glycerol metabolism
MRCLIDYPWPGNVRELENVLERGAVCSRGAVLSSADLSEEVREHSRPRKQEPDGAPPEETAGDAPGGEDEKERILRTLKANRWNRGDAAVALGINRSTLWRKMRRLEIDRKRNA